MSSECCWRRRLMSRAGWRCCCTAPGSSTCSTAPSPTRRRDSVGLLLDILTPVGKSWPSQWCLEANNLAIQVHGGYGYTREYDVEQHYRDNRLNPIHEGTHGIQSLDLLGRKVTQRGGASLAALGDAVSATIATANAAGGGDGRACQTARLDMAAPHRRDRRDVRFRRCRGCARQQRDLSRSLRAHRRRVDMAAASACRRRSDRRLL